MVLVGISVRVTGVTTERIGVRVLPLISEGTQFQALPRSPRAAKGRLLALEVQGISD